MGALRRLRPDFLLQRNRLARLHIDLYCPLHARPIAGVEEFCRCWIQACQHSVEMFWTVSFPDFVNPGPERSICFRAGKQGLPQSPQIETGAANQQGSMTPTLNLFDSLRSFTSPLSGGVVDLRWHKVN